MWLGYRGEIESQAAMARHRSGEPPSSGPIPPSNCIVLTLPHLRRAAAAKLRASDDPDAAELAEAHEGAARLLQHRGELRTPRDV